MADVDKYKKSLIFFKFINFNRNFIKKYSKYAEPLIRLTKKSELFAWIKEQNAAFIKFKNAYIKKTFLYFLILLNRTELKLMN